jgi:hypothetical protein
MRLVGTAESLADPLGKLLSAEQPLGLYDLPLAVDPFGLYCVEPGALLGKQTGHYLHPRASLPLFLTPLLCSAIQLLTSLLVCQLALSQIISNAFLPIAASFWQLYSRNWVVMELTGRPSTNLSHVRSRTCPSTSLVRTNIPYKRPMPSGRCRL